MIPKNENDLIVVDLEMTGLQVKTDRILEIGAVRIHEDQITDSGMYLVRVGSETSKVVVR